MTLHRTSGRWRLGLGLTLATALFWATLPIALKIALEILDPITLTWFRFVVAMAFTAAWLGLRGQLRGYTTLNRRQWWMLGAAAMLLLGNYVFYLLGVQHTTPANAQLLIQLAPLLMALGGIWVFGEEFRAAQWCGLGLLVAGMLLFFRDQLAAAQAAPGYLVGSAWVVVGAVVWAAYALLQKQLLVRLGSMQILLLIYVAASIALLPFAHPSALLRLDAAALGNARLLRAQHDRRATAPSPKRSRTGKPRACRRSSRRRRCCASPRWRWCTCNGRSCWRRNGSARSVTSARCWWSPVPRRSACSAGGPRASMSRMDAPTSRPTFADVDAAAARIAPHAHATPVRVRARSTRWPVPNCSSSARTCSASARSSSAAPATRCGR